MKSTLAILTVFAAISAEAAQPFPTVQPMVGEMVLRLNPTFTSTCLKTSYEKKDGNAPTTTVDKATTTITEDLPGSPKFSIILEAEKLDLRMIIDVTPDRAAFRNAPSLALRHPGTASWTDSETLTGKDKEQAAELKAILTHMLENMSTVNAIGRPLKQGTVISGDACKLIPGAHQQSSSGGFSVAGVAVLDGRRSVVLAGAQSVSCYVGAEQLSIDAQGWYAIDAESGLQASQSFVSKTKLRSSGSSTGEEKMECTITGSSQGVMQSTQSTAEQRLTEIKSLFDKGLITKDQFEQKRADIIKSL